MIKLQTVNTDSLLPELAQQLKLFGDENFDLDEAGDPEWQEEIKEWFWKQPDLQVLAYADGELAGKASIAWKRVNFNGTEILIAGLGGLTVDKQHRHQGIAKMLITERLLIAKEKGADIAFLNTDINKLGGLFSPFGFVALPVNYSFTGKSGAVIEDDSGMIVPVNSPEVFAQIMQLKAPFYIGESNV